MTIVLASSDDLHPNAAWAGRERAWRAACGMGFVATPGAEPSHQVISLGVTALARLSHRGGLDADGKSGDGAGLMIQIPRAIFGGHAVAVLFEWDPRAREILAAALAEFGMGVIDWRRPPLDPDSLGDRARQSIPDIWHAVISRPQMSDEEWEDALYGARRRAEKDAASQGVRMYVPSCSCRTMVFKGLMAGTHLANFYLDLLDERATSQVALFHQRYSTNTLPDWRNAQPFRMISHNGEINTVAGNISWMRAREGELPESLREVIWKEGSDSSALDNTIELLVRRGFNPAEALMTLVPDAWEGRGDMAPRVRDFYRFQSTRFEPWDGPAALSFSDGLIAGVALDRNGLRPIRYQITSSGMVVAGSEAGVVPLPPAEVVERGRLGPGQLLVVDLKAGGVWFDHEAKERVASRHDYGLLADRVLVPVERRPIEVEPAEDPARRQRMFGWGSEDVRMVIHEMAQNALEPTYSMGDDTPIASFGRSPRRIYSHLRQRFAQVTNPAIDSLREKSVMSLRVTLGARGRTLGPDDQDEDKLGQRLHPAAVVNEHTLLELESPVIGAGELARILESAVALDATFAPQESLRGAIDRLRSAALAAPDGILVISDRAAGRDRIPVPMVLAVGAVHEALLAAGQRMQKDLVAVAGDAIDVHDVAMLVTTGAAAVHPYLSLDCAQSQPGDDSLAHFRKALDYGLLKVMSKMGISCASSYCGAEMFEVLALGAEIMSLCLPGVPSLLGGAGFREVEDRLREWHGEAWAEEQKDVDKTGLRDYGRVKFKKTGEMHAYNPLSVRAAQKAAQTGDPEEYRRWLQLSSMGGTPQDLRDLLEIRPAAAPTPLAEVEAATEIRSRFVSTAMSLGALSPEAHSTLALAMNQIGARSNSGEGGEDPDFYTMEGPRRDNKIKQVASARFGVTPAYLQRADELEIKIAQGAKPGEGGQLPGMKVSSLIARLRHAQTGQQLISPPPHHDIYSIEDLAQLIYDLKAINPRAKVGVKLVSESGVGTIAAGVAKARADFILISGHSGGTGAAPMSSIKNAGTPWELGLAETQQTLVAHNLRERVSLRTDGGLRGGRDVVVAAMLGAEEFGFGTGMVVAMGCDMARQCHLNTCPTGIATQREDLRAKFAGKPEYVINFLTLIAEEARGYLALAGARTLDEVVGRVESLRSLTGHGLDLSFLVQVPANAQAPRRRVWARNGDLPAPSPPSGPIDNSHRAVGAGLQGQRRHYVGSAGQSFGAWCDEGTELELEGEANDYVGKGLGGGVLVIRPFADDAAIDPVLAGNTCLYGATGGRLFLAGRAGERFCVRNSGATAVLEGAGDHFCEYMTGGVAVALGRVGWNVGAGMTGGVAYIREWEQLNSDSVVARPVPAAEAEFLKELIQEHHQRTQSKLAARLLADWDGSLEGFRQIVPIASLAPPPAPPEAPEQASVSVPSQAGGEIAVS